MKKITEHSTAFTLQPANSEQMNLCFSGNHPEEAFCIGHLRGDFSNNGAAFYTTWWPHHDELKSAKFKVEFDDIVNGLRKQGILSDFQTMRRRCAAMPDAQISGQWCRQYAFRIDSKSCICFLRCCPVMGDYNFYLYAYDRSRFMEHMRLQKGLPKVCWSTLKTEPGVIAIKYGESGYYRWDVSNYPQGTPAERIADDLNKNGNITNAQVAAMKAGSMFGWFVPAADPKLYDINGKMTSGHHTNERGER